MGILDAPGLSKSIADTRYASNPVTGANGASLPRFRLALAKTLSGQANTRILVPGDSTSYGVGGSNSGVETSTNAWAYPTQLASLLTAAGIPANANGICFGTSLNGLNRLTSGLGDTRITSGTSWSMYNGGASAALGGNLATANTTTNALNYTPTTPVDTFRVWYVQSSTSGTIGAALNGGTVTTHGTNGTSGGPIKSFTVTGTLGTNTLNLTTTGGNSVFVNAIEAWNSAAPSVGITNAGWPGAKTADISSVTSGAYGYDPLAGAIAFAPDLFVLCIGINDWATGVPVATYQSQLQTLVTAYLTVADVILVTPAPSDASSASQATQQAFVSATAAVAASKNVPLVDNWTRWGPHANNMAMYTTSGLGNGLIHPNMIGYNDFARSIARVLTAA